MNHKAHFRGDVQVDGFILDADGNPVGGAVDLSHLTALGFDAAPGTALYGDYSGAQIVFEEAGYGEPLPTGYGYSDLKIRVPINVNIESVWGIQTFSRDVDAGITDFTQWTGMGVHPTTKLPYIGGIKIGDSSFQVNPVDGLQFGPSTGIDVSLKRALDDGAPVLLADAVGFELHDDDNNPTTQGAVYGNSVWGHARDWSVGAGAEVVAGTPHFKVFDEVGDAVLGVGALRMRDVTLQRAAAGVVENPAAGGAVRLHSPDGTAYDVKVANDGTLSAIAA